MKKYILKKKLFAVLFLAVLFLFSILNFVHSFQPLKELLTDPESCTVAMPTELEESINENLYGRMNFLETYGLVQVLLEKRECNNFTSIMDEDGFLHYASFYQEDDPQIFEYAMRLKRMQDYVAGYGTKVMFVVTPGKYVPGQTAFRPGISVNDPNPAVDEMLFYLNRLGVETLDLRESLPNENLSYEETFFKTDHHWTIPAAFCATQEIVKKIQESFGEDLDPEDYYTDISNYEVMTYKKGMLGSMGRKTGAVFSGIEDFTALWPRFTGDYYRESMFRDVSSLLTREGNFAECFMNLEVLKNPDVYADSQYSLYLNGLCTYEKILNRENPEGPSFFMIRDSYLSPVMAFMMPMCGRIDAIWSLEETEELDIEEYLKGERFDYIIMEIYPYNIESQAFHFFIGEES